MDEGMVETAEELLAKQHRKEKKDLQGVSSVSTRSAYQFQLSIHFLNYDLSVHVAETSNLIMVTFDVATILTAVTVLTTDDRRIHQLS